jgi:hypothetical protein
MAFLLSPLKPTKPALNEKLVLTYSDAVLMYFDWAKKAWRRRRGSFGEARGSRPFGSRKAGRHGPWLDTQGGNLNLFTDGNADIIP